MRLHPQFRQPAHTPGSLGACRSSAHATAGTPPAAAAPPVPLPRPHLPAQSSQPIGTSAAQRSAARPRYRARFPRMRVRLHVEAAGRGLTRCTACRPAAGADRQRRSRAAAPQPQQWPERRPERHPELHPQRPRPPPWRGATATLRYPAARERSERRGNAGRPRGRKGGAAASRPAELCARRGAAPGRGMARPGNSRWLAAVAIHSPAVTGGLAWAPVGRPGSHPSSVPADAPDLHPDSPSQISTQP